MISRTLGIVTFLLLGLSSVHAQHHHYHVTTNSTCSTPSGSHCGTCNISCQVGQSAVCIPGKEGCPPGGPMHGGSCWCLENPQCYCK
jgi:hypothetical protein